MILETSTSLFFDKVFVIIFFKSGKCFFSPKITSGIRFGTPAATSRGFNVDDFENVGNLISDTLNSLLLDEKQRSAVNNNVKNRVIELCSKYPIYKEAY